MKVLGIGGFFFRADDPAALADWYERVFGVTKVPDDYGIPGWRQQEGATVFAPFPRSTEYFGRDDQTWMINFRVADLDAAVTHLEALDISVEVDPETYPNGRFARLSDPEGNSIQLWEPSGADA